ncbi:MAG: hypothetical protein MI864_28660, partial [Pseudomonadales bacterium]|nr:hypothetical protein [Pseudomonadales bacterium]
MTAIAEQEVLPLKIKRPLTAGVDDETIDRIPDMQSAIVLSITASGLQEKQIHLELGIAAGQWTRIKTG